MFSRRVVQIFIITRSGFKSLEINTTIVFTVVSRRVCYVSMCVTYAYYLSSFDLFFTHHLQNVQCSIGQSKFNTFHVKQKMVEQQQHFFRCFSHFHIHSIFIFVSFIMDFLFIIGIS